MKKKYRHLTDRFTYFAIDLALVVLMVLEVSREYLSTFNRQIGQQLYNELRRDYAFPRAVCRSLSDLFRTYLDLYFGGERTEGQVIFHAVSRDVPPGVPVEEMHLVPVRLTLYDPGDCVCRTQGELLNSRILRITGEAFSQGALLTQADIAILLGESTKTIARHIAELEINGEAAPTRGSWRDIGPGVSHKKRILELYLRGDEYTDIERKTRHSGEAIMRYVKDFARVLVLTEEGYSGAELRVITGLSDKTIREHTELIEAYSGEEYRERLEHIRAIFRKKTMVPIEEVEKPGASGSSGRLGP
jgi:biotin operon repressor